jgi:hypothetical protein
MITLRPGGPQGCSHGWSAAQPVESGDTITIAPAGAKETNARFRFTAINPHSPTRSPLSPLCPLSPLSPPTRSHPPQ